MGYEESSGRRRANIGFRTSLDIGMGIFYAAIGLLVMYYKAMGTMQIMPTIAYILGSMMVIGGVARFYRGVKTIRAERKQ